MRERILTRVFLSIAIFGLTASSLRAASFEALGNLGGPDPFSAASGVSPDGSVVVGAVSTVPDINGQTDIQQAFRWTRTGGMVGLGQLDGGYDSGATAVSADGSVVVGGGISASYKNYEAYRWTSGGGMVGLGPGDSGFGFGFSSQGTGVSGDGSVVVGRRDGLSNTYAFRWTSADGMVSLDRLSGATRAEANGVSADGSVVVGFNINADGSQAFRWTSSGGIVGLGDLPDGNFDSYANAVSADGNVVVGAGSSASGYEAFRWTSGGGMVDLGNLLAKSFAYGVSGDGSVVVGESEDPNYSNCTAFIWTQASGMQSLLNVLLASGATGLTGWSLCYANAISSDGQWVVGVGHNPAGQDEAFLANIAPVPLPGVGWLLAPAFGGLIRRKVSA